MALHLQCEASMAPIVKEIGSVDPALRALLLQNPVQNLYFLGLLEEFATRADTFKVYGAFEGDRLVAALFVGADGGLVVPASGAPADLVGLARSLMGTVVLRGALGEKPLVDEIVRFLSQSAPKVIREQRLFSASADDLGPFTNPALRLATEADLPRLVPLAAGAVREYFRRDPLDTNPDAFHEHIAERVRARRTYVLEAGGALVFKVDVGAQSQYGAELEGPYTVPTERRSGHATLCLGQIARHLLSSLPRLTLRIDEGDESLQRIARKVGFVPKRVQSLVAME